MTPSDERRGGHRFDGVVDVSKLVIPSGPAPGAPNRPANPANPADIDPGDSHCTACGGSGLRGGQDSRARATPTPAGGEAESRVLASRVIRDELAASPVWPYGVVGAGKYGDWIATKLGWAGLLAEPPRADLTAYVGLLADAAGWCRDRNVNISSGPGHVLADVRQDLIRIMNASHSALSTEDPDPLDGAAHSVWLHGKWRWLTEKMTTEEREAFAAAVVRYSAVLEPGSPVALDDLRWWAAPPTEEPAGWTVSCGWRPTESDPEPRDYPRSYPNWADARQVGRALACGDNVIAVTITAPDGSEAATWSRGGVWRETASPTEEPAQAGAVIAQALDHALEELQTLSARTASMHRRRGHLDAVGIISAALQAARPEAAEEPVPAGRTIRCVFEGGPADGLVPEVRYDSGGEMVPVPSPFIPWQVDGERLIYRYDRAEERDDGPVWVYVPATPPVSVEGGAE